MKNTNLDIRFNKANYLWLITYDLPNDLFDKIDNMGLVPYEYVTHEELTQTYYNQRF